MAVTPKSTELYSSERQRSQTTPLSGPSRSILFKVKSFIEDELSKVDANDESLRHLAFKAAFDKVISHAGAYKPILSTIKAEYEAVIEALQQRQKEAVFLSGKLKTVANEPSTLQTYKKRADQLDANLSVIRSDNERRQLEALRAEREEPGRAEQDSPEVKVPHRKLTRKVPAVQGLGLTLEQRTDPKFLRKELDNLNKQWKELSLAHKTRYRPKDAKLNLKEQLALKVTIRDQLTEKTDLLKYKTQKLKVAVEAAQAYMTLQPPHQTVGDAVVDALHRANTQGALNKNDDGFTITFEDDDPEKEKEAEMMLDYIEKFTEFMEEGKIEEAAVHAANSPKGILRTMETMQRFKDVQVKTSLGRSALLAFSDALLATAPAYDVKPNEIMSFAAIQSALNENRCDLVAHWISNDRLTLSKAIADALCNHAAEKPENSKHCIAWAEHIYLSIQLHKEAVRCMMIQEKLQLALQYAQHAANFQASDYVDIVKEHPSEQLVRALASQSPSDPMVPLGALCTALLDVGKEALALHLLERVFLLNSGAETLDKSTIRQTVHRDSITTMSQWLQIAKLLGKNDHHEVCIEIIAASTVRTSVTAAKSHVLQLESKHKNSAASSESDSSDESFRLEF